MAYNKYTSPQLKCPIIRAGWWRSIDFYWFLCIKQCTLKHKFMDNLIYFLSASRAAMMIFVLIMANGLGVLLQLAAAKANLSAFNRTATARRPDDWVEWVTEVMQVLVLIVGMYLWFADDTFRLSANYVRDAHTFWFTLVVLAGITLEAIPWLEQRFNRIGMHVGLHIVLYVLIFPVLFS